MFRARGTRAIVLLFLLSLPAITTRIYATDEVQYFSFARSLWFDHDLNFTNEFRHFDDAKTVPKDFAETHLSELTPTGRPKTYATIGSALLWMPFYVTGDLVAHALHAMGRPVELDGYSRPYVAAVCLGSAVYACAALLIAAAIARRLVGPPTAAVIAVWIGTPLFFYAYLAPVFGHACEAFAISLLLWTWLRVRRTWSLAGAIALGAAGALAAMVREQDIVFVAGPALDLLWSAVRPGALAAVAGGRRMHWPRVLRTALAAGLTAVIVFAPQAWAYIAINGTLLPASDVQRKLWWWSPYAWQVLFSTEHGFVFWTPLAILAAAGVLLLLWQSTRALSRAGSADAPREHERRALAVCCLVMIALNVYVAGAVSSWFAAGAFGQRRFVSLTPVLAIGVAALLTSIPQCRRALRGSILALVALCVWWNLGLMAQFALKTMDRQKLTLGTNAYETFVRLPLQGPSIAWRFLVDRSSFYHPPAR